MKIKTFVSTSATEIDKLVNTWLEKNDKKIKIHDMKVSGCTGRLIYVLVFDHYAVEEIED